MHLGGAAYRVWPLPLHVALATFLVAAKAIFWLLPLLFILYITFQVALNPMKFKPMRK